MLSPDELYEDPNNSFQLEKKLLKEKLIALDALMYGNDDIVSKTKYEAEAQYLKYLARLNDLHAHAINLELVSIRIQKEDLDEQEQS